jgi:hypothetical protein
MRCAQNGMAMCALSHGWMQMSGQSGEEGGNAPLSDQRIGVNDAP